MQKLALALVFGISVVVSACTGGATTPSQSPAFQKIDLSLGSGAVAALGNTLTVNYSGWLYDPTKADFKGLPFDSSTGFSFTLGTGAVIAGWDQGLTGMNVGGVRRLIVPPSLAYGGSRSGKIPPDASLVFDVTLTAVQ